MPKKKKLSKKLVRGTVDCHIIYDTDISALLPSSGCKKNVTYLDYPLP